MIIINEPIWNIGYFVKGSKGRGVGINEDCIVGTHTNIEILYKAINGTRLYPNIFTIENTELSKFPKKKRKGVTLIYIPLSDLSIKKETLSAG